MKTIYDKVLVELEKHYEIGRLSTKHNNLIKLCHETEDTVLVEHIRAYAEYLPQIATYAKRKLSMNAKNLLDGSRGYENELKNYCYRMIASKKPEWMILAERNGWYPAVRGY